MRLKWLCLLLIALACDCRASGAMAQENRVVNGGFEGPTVGGVPGGWDPFWSRVAGAGSMTLVAGGGRMGRTALRVQHNGAEDWSVGQSGQIAVKPGEIYTLSGWVRSESGEAELGVVTRRSNDETLECSYGRVPVGGKHDWKQYRRRFVVPPDCATIQFRLIGNGPTTLWLDDASLVLTGSVDAYRKDARAATLAFGNRLLDVRCSTASGALTVRDKRSGREWRQEAISADTVVLKAMQVDPHTVRLRLAYLPTDLTLTATFAADPSRPEVTLSLEGDGALDAYVPFPLPFVTGPGSWLVVPLNEGILYPVDDKSVPTMRLVAYSGHGICMPWYGVVAGTAPDVSASPGVMTILNTPDDASIDITRRYGSNLSVQPLWEPSRGHFSYTRKLTYVFTPGGGYVAQAKRYREYAQATGLFKTLAQKRRENPNVDLLVGAANLWNWDLDKVALCRELKAAGVDHLLWSGGGSPEEIRAINKLGYLTSRYDIYQDVYPPDAPAYLSHAGWPEDLAWLPDGSFMHGWADIQKHPDGTQTVYQGGVISSSRGLARARIDIPKDLETHPYGCRFIDTTTASPFREDYNPAHPLTRSEDRRYKMALLDFCSKDEKLVVGTETGIDPSVPYVDYYEGMMSLGPFRLPDAGYDMLGYRKPTPDFLKFMVGSTYRIPLWELVYHECVVAGWYWGDGSNKAPEVWDRRDLFNILYGTPPLFMMNKQMWATERSRFIASYKAVCPIARQFGYDEMLAHRFLTPDHNAQATRWRSGKEIVVNFGNTAYTLPDGAHLDAMRWIVRTAR